MNDWTMKEANLKSESISKVARKKRLDRLIIILLPSSRLSRYASTREFTQTTKFSRVKYMQQRYFYQVELIVDQRCVERLSE